MFCASDNIVSIVSVCVIFPHSCVRDAVRALCVYVASSWDKALDLATR
jgi:hypothetical protein